MILGAVTENGFPFLVLTIAGKDWVAVIDTGFDGGLELPLELKGEFPERSLGNVVCILAGGRVIEEEGFEIEFPIDNAIAIVEGTYADTDFILIGTQLLRSYCLTIHFSRREAYLERDD